jgi:UDP-2-acetamido-2-deoxy-ribo-hexuluronate aminotransferase
VKFIDLQSQYQQHKMAIDAAIQTVLDHGQYINGPEVAQLESDLQQFVGVSHAIGCASGTTALQMALMAVGVGPGDEVITTPFSFFATAEVIVLLGAKPVYVDIDPQTYNINPDAIEAAITPKTKAIIPVSLYGQAADFDEINAIADRHQLPVIEDAAQSLGATYKGRHSGNLSTIACASFFPSKPLGCYGDGGACFTNDDALAEKMRMIANHGQAARYHHTMIGINGRLDTIQAAILIEKLKHFPAEIEARQTVAAEYARCLSDQIQLPMIKNHNVSAYAQYTIQVSDRDNVREALSAQGIPMAVHYPKGLHQQPATKVDENASYPETELAAARVMSLPFYPGMPQETIEKVAAAIHQIVRVAV